MSSELSERYNESLVPAPDLSNQVPPLRQPARHPSSEKIPQSQERLALIVGILAVLGVLCLLLTVAAVYVAVLLWP
jgi:hypothetical protein